MLCMQIKVLETQMLNLTEEVDELQSSLHVRCHCVHSVQSSSLELCSIRF